MSLWKCVCIAINLSCSLQSPHIFVTKPSAQIPNKLNENLRGWGPGIGAFKALGRFECAVRVDNYIPLLSEVKIMHPVCPKSAKSETVQIPI